MKAIWKLCAWLSVVCGLTTFLIGWTGLIQGGNIFGIAPEFYFFDAIGAVLFGIFFLLWGKLSEGSKK